MKISNICTELLLQEDFEDKVYSFLEARSAEQKAGVPSYWTRCEPSFVLYVILDCTIQHFMKKENDCTWKSYLHLTSLLRKCRTACSEKYGKSSKEHATIYADGVISSMTMRGLLADMVPFLDYVLQEPFDADFEAQFYVYLDARAGVRRGEVEPKRVKPIFVVCVLNDLYGTWLMKQMGLAGLTRILAGHVLRQERAKWKAQCGKSTKRHADHYAGLITENMAQLGIFYYDESKAPVNKCVEK